MSASLKSLFVSTAFSWCASAFGSTPWTVSTSLDYYAPQGTPNIGTVGGVESRHINRLSPVVAVDYVVKDWLSFELNYRYTPEFTTRKVSGNLSIFPLPPGSLSSPALQYYDLVQTINTVSFGPNCSLRLGHGFRLSVGAFAAFENVASEIDLIFWVSSGSSTSYSEDRRHYLSSHENSIRPSGRVRLEYSVTPSTSLLASWTFIDSASTSASYLGLGVAHHF